VEDGPLRLTGADFDAFLEQNSRSLGQASAAQRRVLRERIERWASAVVPRLAELGIAAEVVVPDEVEQHMSSRSPRAIAQRVLFVRDAFARSGVPRRDDLSPGIDPLRAHAYLALTIDSVHVEVSLEIPPEAEADVKNVRARIADPPALLELTSLFETVPAEFGIGVIGVPSFPRVEHATAEDVRALLDDSERSRRPLWIGWTVKREVALAHASELGELLPELAHVYKLVAWASDNDLIAYASGRRARRRAPRDEERRERREERRKRRGARKGPVRIEGSRREREDARRIITVAEREAATSRRGQENVKDPEPARPDPMRPLPARRPILPTTLRARGAPPAKQGDADKKAPIEKGTRVKVLAGPFANKLGVVQAIDGKGRARVQLGLLAATLDLSDLVAQTDAARPMLASSHRRPRNARSR